MGIQNYLAKGVERWGIECSAVVNIHNGDLIAISTGATIQNEGVIAYMAEMIRILNQKAKLNSQPKLNLQNLSLSGGDWTLCATPICDNTMLWVLAAKGDVRQAMMLAIFHKYKKELENMLNL